MSYSDFDLKQVKQNLGLKLIEKQNLFAAINSVEISPSFQATLTENIPLARAINTEKARSELIIINVLVEFLVFSFPTYVDVGNAYSDALHRRMTQQCSVDFEKPQTTT